MAKNRYKNGLKSFMGQMKVLSTDNPFLYKVQIWALNDKTNRNNWRYINLAAHLPKFRNIPLLTAYLPTGKIGDGHNFDMKRDPQTGESYASFTASDAERIVGWVPESANVKLVEKDGVNWVVVEASLWTWYARELVSQIVRQGDKDPMEVSIETLIRDEYMEDGVAVEKEYDVLGITILGRGVAPAVAGATIKSLAELSAIRDSMNDLVIKAASYADKDDPKVNNKGVKALIYFSRKQLAELETRFNGYQAIAAAQDDKGIYVCLMKNGEPYTYTMASVDETIAPERIVAANAMVRVNFSNDVHMEVDSSVYGDSLCAELTKANNAKAEAEKKAKTAEEELNKANSTITSMVEAEKQRRVVAAKNAAKAALDAFNANRAKPVEEKVLEAINADIDHGTYTELCDEHGAWNGEEAVRDKVLAACAKEQMAVDKQLADKSKTNFAWTEMGLKQGESGDAISDVLSSLGIE